jgi:ABC-type lipoprotein export system ATPase subunit
MVLEADDISKTYAREKILDRVSLCLEAGEMTAITGKSGCGKTTLLSILGLLQETDAGGRLRLEGRAVNGLPTADLARLRRERIGFIFQRARLDGALTAWENVMLPAWLFGKATASLQQRAEQLLKDFGLKDRRYHLPGELSVGQLRRIATARALLLRPALILADEPTNDLDAESAGIVFQALLQAKIDGAALLLVTHDQHYAYRADKTMQLRAGRLQLIG